MVRFAPCGRATPETAFWPFQGWPAWSRLLPLWTPHAARLRETLPEFCPVFGGCRDLADAEWIVIRGPFRGHNDMPFGQPAPGRPIGLSVARGLTTLRVYLVFLGSID
jgi:hypothetical protein